MAVRKLSPGKLKRCVKLAYPILKRVARERGATNGTITYKDLLNEMGGSPGRHYIGDVLDRINELEKEKGLDRPKLTAVVVLAHTGTSSGGILRSFDTPAKLRRTRNQGRNPNLTDAEKKYWEKTFNRVRKRRV